MMRRISVLLVAVVVALPAGAQAAGVTTHAFMAETAVSHVTTPALKALLTAQRGTLLAGAAYPDGGYAVSSLPGGDYGEVSHWERFVNAYVRQLRSRGCGLTPASLVCAPLVAHLMGAAAHGMGDETWDWMFEPLMADHHESPEHPIYRSGLPGFAELRDVPPGSLINTSEYAMDMVAIAEHDRALALSVTVPPVADLVSVYRALGRSDITATGVLAGNTAITAALAGERFAAVLDYPRVKATMPVSAASYLDHQGGVRFTGRAIAGYYEALWAKLTRTHPAPRAAATYPLAGQTGVPVHWHPALTGPGPRGGGAQTRLIVVLTNAVDPATVTPETFVLRDAAGSAMPPHPGFPAPGPYGAGDGTHSVAFYPVTDLEPCTTYTAELTTGVRDLAGVPLAAPVRWSFTTVCG